MLLYNDYPKHFPTAEELPYSDDTPVDSEQQRLISLLLREVLLYLWEDRQDWFFGLDMAWYYHPDEPPIVPDGFLSLGVERVKASGPRLSYVQWEENQISPILTVEVVSKTPGGEFKRKKSLYAQLGVLYYVIIAPRRRRKPKLTIYHLENGEYQLITANPLWIQEIGLGIGMEWGTYQGMTENWLYWYDQAGSRYWTETELKHHERERRLLAEQRATESEQRAEQLAQRLRELGIDPDQL